MTSIWIFLLLLVAPVIEAEVEASRSHHNDDNTIVANDLQSNYEGEILPRDVRASDDVISVSQALHLDVLRHSISYLRERLLTCLRSHSKNGMRHQVSTVVVVSIVSTVIIVVVVSRVSR